jgi:hypothetical protein
MEICKGGGDCITSKYVDGYDMSCKHNCKPRNCLNFLVCNSNQANSIMMVGSELCFSCDITFVKPHIFLENIDCQICPVKQVQGVKRFTCDHAVCLRCFKKAHYGDPPPKPKFPYENEVELEYMENIWDARWLDDPLIVKYNSDYQCWIEKLHTNFRECDPIRVCKECT